MEAALHSYRESLVRDPNSFECHFHIGRISLEMGKYDDAVEFLVTAKNLNSDSLDTCLLLAKAYFFKRQYQDSHKELEQVLMKDPENCSAHFELGNLFLETEKLVEALQEYQIVLNHPPSFLEWIYLKKGDVFRGLGLLEEGIQQYRKALEHDPFNVIARSHLVESLKVIGEKKEAISQLKTLFMISKEEKWLNEAIRLKQEIKP